MCCEEEDGASFVLIAKDYNSSFCAAAAVQWHTHRMKMLQSSNFKRQPTHPHQPARPLTLHLLALNVKIRVLIALRYVLGQRLIPIFGRCAALLPYIVAIMSLHALLATLFFTLDDFLCRLFVLFLFEFYAVLEVVLP